MTTTAIKQKLLKYIDTADHKKIKAIYTLVENEIEDESDDKWNDKNFVAEINRRREEYKTGSAKLFTLDEVEKKARQVLKKVKSK